MVATQASHPTCFQVNITLDSCPHRDLDHDSQTALCHTVADTCGLPRPNLQFHGCEVVDAHLRRLAEKERSLRGISLPIRLPSLFALENCIDVCVDANKFNHQSAAQLAAMVQAKLDVAISSSKFDTDLHNSGCDELKSCHTTHSECGDEHDNHPNAMAHDGHHPDKPHKRHPGHPGVMASISSLLGTH
jgi:hypothetical protein